MAGRMGGKRVTQVGLAVHSVDPEQNLLLVKGAVPGPKNGIVEVREDAKVAAPKAPVLDAGGAGGDVTLEEAVFGAEVKPHLVHEAVRAELNARRAGTRAAKSRGLVAGGRAKPWRQKGTGRARAGTIRAPQFTGGGVAFPPACARFAVKVNRKARRAALRAALSAHARRGRSHRRRRRRSTRPRRSRPSTCSPPGARSAAPWSSTSEDEETLIKSFRNLDRVLVTVPAEVEVAAGRLGAIAARHRGGAASSSREGLPRDVSIPTRCLLAPVVSEKSYSRSSDRKYSFKVHPDAHKTQIRQAVEQLFDVHVENVNVLKVQPKPKRRGMIRGHAARLEEGDRAACARARRSRSSRGLRSRCRSDDSSRQPGPALHDGLRLRRGHQEGRPRSRCSSPSRRRAAATTRAG